MQRIRYFGIFCPKWISTSHPFLLRHRDHPRREKQKIIRTIGVDGWLQANNVFTTWKGNCTHGLAAVMTTCARPVKTPNTKEGVIMKSQPCLRSYRQVMAAGTGRASNTHKHPLETLLTTRLHVHHLETQRRKWTNTWKPSRLLSSHILQRTVDIRW